MAVTGTITTAVDIREQTTTNTAGAVQETVTLGGGGVTLTDGTGANQVNKLWSKTATLTATSVTFDLTALTGAKGSVTFTKIKAILVKNNSTADGEYLYVGNAASDPFSAFTDTAATRLKVPSGSTLVVENLTAQATGAWTVNSSNKNLKLDSGSSTISYTVLVIGV